MEQTETTKFTAYFAGRQKCETLVVPDLLSCIGCDGGSLSCPSGCRHAAYKCYVYVDGDRRLRDHYLDKINKSVFRVL